MPPTPTRLSYRIKSTDNATTMPGRTFFPKGTYVTQAPKLPTSNYYNSERYRTPYTQNPGTLASGMNGFQGTPFAMAPVQPPPTPTYLQSQTRSPQQPFAGVPSSFYSRNLPVQTGQGLAQQWQTNQRLYRGGATDDSWYSPPGQAAPLANPAAANIGPGQYINAQGQVAQGAAPFGVNAYGERLDVNGNVWNPETATADIYGGKFIQEGSVRWERNRAGRLIKVKYGSGGRKRVIAGGKGQAKKRAAEQAAAAPVTQPVQQVVQQPSIANAMVTFRA